MSPFARGFLFGRHSGWEVNPTTRCIVAPFFSEAFRKVAEHHGLHGDHLLRRRNPHAAAKYASVPELNDDELYQTAKFEHELDHLQRHLSTSYGFLTHLIKSRMVDLFVERIDQTSTNADGTLPWYPESMARSASPDDAVDARSRNTALFTGYRHLLQLLSCENAAGITLPTAEQSRLAYWALETDLFLPTGLALLPTSTTSFDWISSDYFRAEYPILPSRKFGPTKLGGQGLLEAFAIVREMSGLSYAKLQDRRDGDQLDAAIYAQAMLAWKELAMLPRAEVEPSKRWKWAGYEKLWVFPVAFFAASDLALWPPIGPNGWIAPEGVNAIVKPWRVMG